MKSIQSFRLIAIVLAVLMPVSLFAVPARAKDVFHKHPVASGIAAAVIAHHMAKKGAQARIAQGKKPNFAERHPMMTGIAAGVVTHHMLKDKKKK